MKITVYNAEKRDLLRISELLRTYIAAGYADGSRPRSRHAVLFAPSRSFVDAAVWGGPDHIRVSFTPLAAEGE